jgi:hypothetical protein
MLYYLTIVETLISLYWLVNGIMFYQVEMIKTYCSACFFTSIFYIFIQTFDWVFFTCSLHNILCFQDPLKERNFPSRLNLYILLSAGISGLFTYAVFATGTYGLSPMLTCFINNSFNDPNKNIAVYSILILPTVYVFYSIYSFVNVFKHRKVKNDSDFKMAVVKYMIYAILYIVFYFPSIILYVISINSDILVNSFLSWFSWFCSLATISINLALCLFRIIEGYVKCHWKALVFHKDLDQSLMTDPHDDSSCSGLGSPQEAGSNVLIQGEIKNDLTLVVGNNEQRSRGSTLKLQKKLSQWEKISLDIFAGVRNK